MTTTQSLWGKEGQKVAIDFCIHPDVALKKGAAYIFPEKVGLTQPLKNSSKAEKSKTF